MSDRSQIASWHKRIAAVAGSLSLCLEKKSVNIGDLKDWSKRLGQISLEMTNFSGKSRPEREKE